MEPRETVFVERFLSRQFDSKQGTTVNNTHFWMKLSFAQHFAAKKSHILLR